MNTGYSIRYVHAAHTSTQHPAQPWEPHYQRRPWARPGSTQPQPGCLPGLSGSTPRLRSRCEQTLFGAADCGAMRVLLGARESIAQERGNVHPVHSGRGGWTIRSTSGAGLLGGTSRLAAARRACRPWFPVWLPVMLKSRSSTSRSWTCLLAPAFSKTSWAWRTSCSTVTPAHPRGAVPAGCAGFSRCRFAMTSGVTERRFA